MDENAEWTPRLMMTPEGAANLFLMTAKCACGVEGRDDLVALFRLYYEEGYKAGKLSQAESEPAA